MRRRRRRRVSRRGQHQHVRSAQSRDVQRSRGRGGVWCRSESADADDARDAGLSSFLLVPSSFPNTDSSAAARRERRRALGDRVHQSPNGTPGRRRPSRGRRDGAEPAAAEADALAVLHPRDDLPLDAARSVSVSVSVSFSVSDLFPARAFALVVAAEERSGERRGVGPPPGPESP